MKLICITDIHGYLDTALETLKALEAETGMKLLEDDRWVSNHKLIVNGDVFDRGPQNQEALEWVIDNADVYLLGNHEFFGIFPDITKSFLSDSYIERTGKKGQYWMHMDEEMRYRLLKHAANGEIKVAYREHSYTYIHAGVEKTDIEDLNNNLRSSAKKLLEAFGDKSNYRKTQRDIAWVEDTDRGSEIRSKYPKLFEVGRNSKGGLESDAVIWTRFNNLDTEVLQVVGHSTGSYLSEMGYSYNPQWSKAALNINTIRDNVNEDKPVTVTVENEERLEIYELEI